MITFDRKTFFNAVRSAPFSGRLTQGQVDGLNRLLNVWEEYCQEFPLKHLSYDLATSFWETAKTMQPIKERGKRSYFDKYEPGTRLGRILGNTKTGDGYRFRGEGDVQNTGRRNARFSSDRLNEKFGLNVDFEANPDKRGDPLLSALCLFLGNEEGWWTGKKLSDYTSYYNMRRVVNGTDKAQTIANLARNFEAAVKASVREGVQPAPTPDPDPAPAPGPCPCPAPEPSPPQGNFFMSFFSMLLPLGLQLIRGLFPARDTGDKPASPIVNLFRSIFGIFSGDAVVDDSGIFGLIGQVIPSLQGITPGGEGIGDLISGGNNWILVLVLFVLQMWVGNLDRNEAGDEAPVPAPAPDTESPDLSGEHPR